MASYDNIVTLGLPPDDAASLSGLQLIDAPGLTLKTLNNVADETYINGINLAMKKKNVALTLFQNDFLGALQANRVMTTINEPVYDTAVFNPNVNIGASTLEWGTMIVPNKQYHGALRTLHIKNIELYPLTSGTVIIKIYDGFTETTFPPQTVTANQVNTFASTYVVNKYSTGIKILVNAPTIQFASAVVICGEGCNGASPNPCGYANGWSGTAKNRSEGYGMNIQFSCHCDYTQIITDMAKSMTGELIFLKWQIAIWEEYLSTDRFNFITIYSRDDVKDRVLPKLENKYNQKWNLLMDGLFAILKTYKDSCLDCRGISWKTNV